MICFSIFSCNKWGKKIFFYSCGIQFGNKWIFVPRILLYLLKTWLQVMLFYQLYCIVLLFFFLVHFYFSQNNLFQCLAKLYFYYYIADYSLSNECHDPVKERLLDCEFSRYCFFIGKKSSRLSKFLHFLKWILFFWIFW